MDFISGNEESGSVGVSRVRTRSLVIDWNVMSSNPEEVGLSTLNVTAVIIDRNIAILIVNFDRCVARFNAQKLLITRDNDAVRIINRETAILLVFAQCTNRRRRQDSRTTPTDKKKKKKNRQKVVAIERRRLRDAVDREKYPKKQCSCSWCVCDRQLAIVNSW